MPDFSLFIENKDSDMQQEYKVMYYYDEAKYRLNVLFLTSYTKLSKYPEGRVLTLQN